MGIRNDHRKYMRELGSETGKREPTQGMAMGVNAVGSGSIPLGLSEELRGDKCIFIKKAQQRGEEARAGTRVKQV